MNKYWLGKHRTEGSKPPTKKGIKLSDEHKLKISKKLKGIKRSEETKLKMGLGHKGLSHPAWNKGLYGYNSGEKHPRWKGITPLNKLFRRCAQWEIWRMQVFLKDNFTCQKPNCEFCQNKIGIKLHPHHIKPLSLFPELVFNVDNGMTYCEEFHLKGKLHCQMKERFRRFNKINNEINFSGGKNCNESKSMV